MKSKAIEDWKRKVAHKREKERLRLQRKKEAEQEKILNILKGKHEKLEPVWIDTSGIMHGFDVEKELTNYLSKAICDEIDKELVSDITYISFDEAVEPMGSTEVILDHMQDRWIETWKKN